jgi:predicted CoA-binding protein
MNHDSYPDAYIRDILTRNRTIAMVGASPNTSRPSYFAMKYLKEKGFHIIPVNPGHEGQTILGEKVYGSLAAIPDRVDIVDIFRNSAAALGITREAIAIGAKVVWMQLGVRNDEAARLAEEAGIEVVMNRCPKIEYGRLSGELSWAGVNSRTLSSRRPLLGAKGVQHRVIAPKA